MSKKILINAQHRDHHGTADSRRIRLTGALPAVLYGAGKDNEHIVLNHDEMYHNLEREGFVSSILSVKTDKGTQQAILRAVQMHPYKQQVMHVDFLRIKETQAMTIKVPVHLIGEDEAPGTRLEGGILTQSVNDIDISCLPKDLPDHLEIDITELGLGESLHMNNIILPEGVQLAAFMHIDKEDEAAMQDADQAVVAIISPRVEEEEQVDDIADGTEGDVSGDESEEADSQET